MVTLSLCDWFDNGTRGFFRTRAGNSPLLEEFNLILPPDALARELKSFGAFGNCFLPFC